MITIDSLFVIVLTTFVGLLEKSIIIRVMGLAPFFEFDFLARDRSSHLHHRCVQRVISDTFIHR
jgi:hypothetical protein